MRHNTDDHSNWALPIFYIDSANTFEIIPKVFQILLFGYFASSIITMLLYCIKLTNKLRVDNKVSLLFYWNSIRIKIYR